MKRWIAAVLTACMLAVPAGAADQPSDWALEAVQTAREAGLVPEKLDSAYDRAATRAEFCALAAAVYRSWETEGLLGKVEKDTVLFTDCKEGDVLLCASVGIVNGVGGGRFEPGRSLQRQEAASMLHRLGALRADYDGSVQGRLPHVFADGADIASWARNDINWVYRHGIMTGTGGNAFEPAGEYTREQSIATMLRLYAAQYAAEIPKEQGEAYRVVVDYSGAGVGRVHIEDAAGNRLLTDFAGTDGYFYDARLLGEWASLHWQPDVESGFACAFCNLRTGVTWADYYADGVDERPRGGCRPRDRPRREYPLAHEYFARSGAGVRRDRRPPCDRTRRGILPDYRWQDGNGERNADAPEPMELYLYRTGQRVLYAV